MIKCIFSDVSERDMDLLFLEEFVSSEEFLHIFLSKISLENVLLRNQNYQKKISLLENENKNLSKIKLIMSMQTDLEP